MSELIFPVVIDDTTAVEARVPDKFASVSGCDSHHHSQRMRLDPRMASSRDDPEITTLLAESESIPRRAGVSDRDLPLKIGSLDSRLPGVNGQNTDAAGAEDSPKK